MLLEDPYLRDRNSSGVPNNDVSLDGQQVLLVQRSAGRLGRRGIRDEPQGRRLTLMVRYN